MFGRDRSAARCYYFLQSVIGEVVFQNQMQNKANALIESLGLEGYAQYQGSDVLANIYTIDTLPQFQQVVIRTAVHESLRGVWIMVSHMPYIL